jgi:hypothetical protein
VEPLVDSVLRDTEHEGDLASVEPVPGRETKKLAIDGAELIQGPKEEIDLLVSGLVGIRPTGDGPAGNGSQSGGEADLAASTPVAVADQPIGDTEEPGTVGAVRDVVESPPGDGEHIGRRIFGFGDTEASRAVAVDGVVVGLEQGVETMSGIGVLFGDGFGFHCGLPGMLCVRLNTSAYRGMDGSPHVVSAGD